MGKEAAEGVVNYIDHKLEKDMENKSQQFATKEDLFDTKVTLKDEMYKMKVDLIKWMVTLGVSLGVALGSMIIGLYFKK